MIILMLCIKIFFARIIDVSLGTVRILVLVKGKTFLAACIAFVELLIWFVVAREALTTIMTSWWIPISYAAGYSTGTLIGSFISEKFIKGFIGVQVISSNITEEDIAKIRDNGYAVSIIDLENRDEDKNGRMLYIQIKKTKYNSLIKLLKSIDNHAFVVVNDTKHIENGFLK